MAAYQLSGYAAPAGVDSREEVRAYQRMLGVRTDGIWGPLTEAAYQTYASKNQDPYSANIDAFKSYYDAILGALSTPGITVKTPTREELARDYTDILRPGVDLAINKRRVRGDEAMAEIDADAAARGMAASTYVSSMKEREDDDVQEDVSMMEAQYTATLAERIASALDHYAALGMQAASANAQMAASARNAAAGIAAQWYGNYLDTLSAGPAFSGAVSAASGNSAAGGGLSEADYYEYVSLLSASEREALFTSGAGDWAGRREELVGALGKKAYEALVQSYGRTLATSGGGAWAMTLR